jgi:hypothetical protein
MLEATSLLEVAAIKASSFRLSLPRKLKDHGEDRLTGEAAARRCRAKPQGGEAKLNGVCRT